MPYEASSNILSSEKQMKQTFSDPIEAMLFNVYIEEASSGQVHGNAQADYPSEANVPNPALPASPVH